MMKQLPLLLGLLSVPILFDIFLVKLIYGIERNRWDENLPFYENLANSFAAGAIAMIPIFFVIGVPAIIWILITSRKT